VPATVILVHGYSGSPDDLTLLADALRGRKGLDSVRTVRLPGHASRGVPAFDMRSFTGSVVEAVRDAQQRGLDIVLFGHSTGGIIALNALAETGAEPLLLVLASVPKKIDTNSFARWSDHRKGKSQISFTSVAAMVSMIKKVGKSRFKGSFPVFVLQGERDALVPGADTADWSRDYFRGPVRAATVPGAGHDVLQGPNCTLAVDLVARAIDDVVRVPSREDRAVLERILAVEPDAGRFLDVSPFSAHHLALSPSGQSAAGQQSRLSPIVPTEPVIANIEITTRCTMRCVHCARTLRGVDPRDMPKGVFSAILDLLPHAYRVTLVGLGETLMHPQVADLVREASSRGRRTALVTNAMLLDEGLSRSLLDAGLESIAFSIDAGTQDLAAAVRPGTDLARVVANIRRFVDISRSTREISIAVFSAVSTETIDSLDLLMELVSGLGVHVMMLTDLNFGENIGRTLWKNGSVHAASMLRTAVSSAFRKNLPVLSVRGLEEFGLWKRYNKFLLLPPDQLYMRSSRRSWCASPWQTIPINVQGEATLCDCQPGIKAGNLLAQPLSAIWNGDVFRDHRQRMTGDDPPEACRTCPRF